jgi:hypothetical protein
MEAYGGVDVQIHVFLTSALVDEWSTLRPRRFTLGTPWIGGGVGPTTCLDDMERENSCPYRDSNSDASVVQPVASHYADCAIPALDVTKSYIKNDETSR